MSCSVGWGEEELGAPLSVDAGRGIAKPLPWGRCGYANGEVRVLLTTRDAVAVAPMVERWKRDMLGRGKAKRSLGGETS